MGKVDVVGDADGKGPMGRGELTIRPCLNSARRPTAPA